MTLRFDHAIIYGDQLESLISDFETLGFTVLRGGEHPDMGTHNALIIFQNNTYIELLAPIPGRTQQGFPGRLGEQGFAGYCLRADSLEMDLRPASARGVGISPLIEGGRTRPDGQQVKWRLATIHGLSSPFFIEDLTETRLRVPQEEAVNRHVNGAVGLDRMTVLVADVSNAAPRFASIFGKLPNFNGGRAVFDIEGFSLTLRPPGNQQERSYLQERPDMPYEIEVHTVESKKTGLLDLSQSHSARIQLHT